MRGGDTRSPTKALPGRGRRRAKWVSSLHTALLKEYERLHATGLKIISSILQSVAKELVKKAPSESDFEKEVNAQDGVPILNKINARWIDQFMYAHEIILRWTPNRTNRRSLTVNTNSLNNGTNSVNNNGSVPPTNTGTGTSGGGRRALLETHVVFHLGELKRGFENGTFDDNIMESAGDVRFIMNLPSGRSLGLSEHELREEDIPSLSSVTKGTVTVPEKSDERLEGEKVSVLIRMRSGEHAKVEVPLVIFSDPFRTYPLEGIVDSVTGACCASCSCCAG